MATTLQRRPRLLEIYDEPEIAEKTPEAARAWSEGLQRTSAHWPGAFTLDGSLSQEQMKEIESYYLHPNTLAMGYRAANGRFLAAMACHMTDDSDEPWLPANHLYCRFWFRSPEAQPGLGMHVMRTLLRTALSNEMCDGIVLHVRPDNQAAINLYQSLTFDRYVYMDQLEDVMHLPRDRIANVLGNMSLQPQA